MFNNRFQFTVKAYQGITHLDRFGRKSREYFEAAQQIGEAMQASVMLFQSPASFQRTAANTKKIKEFFETINRGSILLAWEPRGEVV